MSDIESPFAELSSKRSDFSLVQYLKAIDQAIEECGKKMNNLADYLELKGTLAAQAEKLGEITDFPDQLLELAKMGVAARIERIEKERGGFFENKRSLMNNAQAWGLHFSNVRVTVTTFLTGVAWGVVATHWEKFDPRLQLSAMIVWTMTVALFCAFTRATFAKAAEEKRNLEVVRLGNPAKPGTEKINWGWSNFLGHVFSILLAWSFVNGWSFCWSILFPIGVLLFGVIVPLFPAEGEKEDCGGLVKRLIRISPDVVLATATGLFGFFLQQWAHSGK